MSSRRSPVLLGRAEERAVLDRLLDDVREAQSSVLVLRGEAGVGKTALLHYCARQAAGFRVARVAGVESEMELAYAGLHQLCSPMLDRLDGLPEPQRVALYVALGLSTGVPPDRFLVALATLSLLAEVATERPLLCLIDDAHWLDAASGQVLGFVARRLLAESVALVMAVREPSAERQLSGLPELALEGLEDEQARALLATVVPGRIDERIRDRIVAETRGIPLAILELPHELAPGGLARTEPLAGRIEDSFQQRLRALPDETRRLLLLAAAEPVGDPLLVWRAAERLDGASSAVAADAADGLLAIGERVVFRHPLVRSAVYRSASLPERRAAHLALAEATDEQVDPDTRAWHLAQASTAPDEAIASELERSANRAQARGGLGAAAAFLERAAMLSTDPQRRAGRLLEAAASKRDAGALDAALRLVGAVDADELDELGRARVDLLRGQIAFDQRRARDAAQLLAGAARQLEPGQPGLARKTHLEALGAAMWVGDRHGPGGMRALAEAALRAPQASDSADPSDVLLDAFAVLITDGYATAAPALRRALDVVLAPQVAADDHGHWFWFAVAGNAVTVAQELWDADAWRALTFGHEQFVRETGALVHLQFSLNMTAWAHLLAGETTKAALDTEEDRTIAQASGNPPLSYSEMLVAAWRGQDEKATELIAATARAATAGGLSRVVAYSAYASGVLNNALGRPAEARDAVLPEFERDHAGYGPFLAPELAEAAARTGDGALLASVHAWIRERALLTRSPWALGVEARVRALLSEGEAADRAYREAIERLSTTWLRPELARSHLLYGEWLRREGRRVDAREQLRIAHAMLRDAGMDGFAARARRELHATGEKVRKRRPEASDELTPQEHQIARLAREGLTNPEIGARLFLSPRTVEWHLKKVFAKLGISSRMGLHDALGSRPGS
jgi:DNA-binding CsgD family transcriptional regulator